MSNHRVILVNQSLGITQGSVVVSGHSRKPYGYSKYEAKHGGHVIEMTPEEYRKAANDLARNWHKSRCKWVPFFEAIEEPAKVIEPANSPELREMRLELARNLSSDELLAILGERGTLAEIAAKFTTAATEITSPVIPETTVTNQTTIQTDLPNRYWSLVKIAKDEGATYEGLKKITDLQGAILANRQKKAA